MSNFLALLPDESGDFVGEAYIGDFFSVDLCKLLFCH